MSISSQKKPGGSRGQAVGAERPLRHLLLLRLDAERLLPLRLLPLALARSLDERLPVDERLLLERPLFFAWAPRRPASLLLILPPEDEDREEGDELRDAMGLLLVRG